MPEQALIGWKAIAEMFQCSPRSMMRRKSELIQCGAIFYQFQGRPPRRIVCAFPSCLKEWIMIKGSKNETF
jgi:hypothetical protein